MTSQYVNIMVLKYDVTVILSDSDTFMVCFKADIKL